MDGKLTKTCSTSGWKSDSCWQFLFIFEWNGDVIKFSKPVIYKVLLILSAWEQCADVICHQYLLVLPHQRRGLAFSPNAALTIEGSFPASHLDTLPVCWLLIRDGALLSPPTQLSTVMKHSDVCKWSFDYATSFQSLSVLWFLQTNWAQCAMKSDVFTMTLWPHACSADAASLDRRVLWSWFCADWESFPCFKAGSGPSDDTGWAPSYLESLPTFSFSLAF